MPLEFGVALPNLGFAMDPRNAAGHRDLVLAVAEQADALGFAAVWAGDHLALPRKPRKAYPYAEGYFLPADSPLLDPIATLAVVAGRTRRVKLGFGVLVAPYRHPLVAAKLLSTLDVLSGGRVILGVGTGWMPEEFEATGAGYARRGKMTDEWVRYVREAWTAETPEFAGEFYRLSGMTIYPKPVQKPSVPIWIGGNTKAALRRAAALGDGWDALHALPSVLKQRLDELRAACAERGRDPRQLAVSVRAGPLKLTERPDRSPDRQPLQGAPDQVIETLRDYAALGVRHVVLGTSRDDRRAQLASMERFAHKVLPAFPKPP